MARAKQYGLKVGKKEIYSTDCRGIKRVLWRVTAPSGRKYVIKYWVEPGLWSMYEVRPYDPDKCIYDSDIDAPIIAKLSLEGAFSELAKYDADILSEGEVE